MGWDVLNLLSTIGAFLLAFGILIMLLNILWSIWWGDAAGDDPWGGNTLEWSTSSPPPNYNFATIPVVRSANPNWDRGDRADDDRRLEAGELLYAEGHETVATSEIDANLEGVLEMPSDSPWPLAVALSLAICFTGLIAKSNATAWTGVALAIVALGGWHVPRSARSERGPSESRSTGWWAMVLVIASEATLFLLLLATYFYLRFKADGQWPPGARDPAILKPLLAMLLLVASSVPLALYSRQASSLRMRLALLAAVALGVAFLVFQGVLVHDSLDRFGPRDHAYGSIYYTLIGLHAAHVAAGVLLAAWAALRASRFDRTASTTVQVTTLYWHFVNAVAVLVFLVLYLSPRI
jgi:cytochrome c oxidase subunit I+III